MTTTQEVIDRSTFWEAVRDEGVDELFEYENDPKPVSRPVYLKGFGIPGFRSRTKR